MLLNWTNIAQEFDKLQLSKKYMNKNENFEKDKTAKN